ncbi:hypothetical protein V492_01359 [Pseudogymnoascus sp. VKM F-4246]|nr:hypothetical protein V492_01359 [Pseudogymnoascus sp. VKM F-4246]
MENPSLSPEAIAFAARVYDAARAGQMDLFEQALPAGLPANMTNEKGDSLVMLAAYHGHSELVKLLISNGANPNALNDRGQSPLAGAVFKNESEVVKVIRPLPSIAYCIFDSLSPREGHPYDLYKRILTQQQALLEGGADPDHGAPSAMEAIVLFKKEDMWKKAFEEAPGKGKGAAAASPQS